MNAGKEAITLTVVGSSGSTSGPDSPASCYLVRAPWRGGTYSVLLDCGPGAFGALYRYLDPAELDAVALSHLHPDHCLDLCAYVVAARHGPGAPWSPVDLYGPPRTLERLARAYDPGSDTDSASRATDELATVFTAHDWAADQRLGPFTVRTARTAHPAPCWATRFEAGGASVVFSGDTGPTPALVSLARDTDLLLCEAAFADPGPDDPANPPGVHLTPTGAGEHAAAAGAGRLVITHVPPWFDRAAAVDAARTRYRGPVDPAVPGAVFAVSPSG